MQILPLVLSAAALTAAACAEPPSPCRPGSAKHGGRCVDTPDAAQIVEPAPSEPGDVDRAPVEPDPDDTDEPEPQSTLDADVDVPPDHTAPDMDAEAADAGGADVIEPDPPDTGSDSSVLDAGDAAPELCSASDFERWRGFVDSDAAVSTIGVCAQQNPGCFNDAGPCALDRCLRHALEMSGCDACVSLQTQCVAEACLNDCGESSTSAACRACACAYGCLATFSACAGRTLTCAAPEQPSDLVFYSRQERSARAYASDQVVGGDFNGDGQTDLLLADFAMHVLRLYTGDGFGHFSSLREWSELPPAFDFAVTGMFNADAYTDIVLVDRAQGRVSIYASDGAGGTTLMATHETLRPWSLVLPGYFDTDQVTDLLFANFSARQGSLYLSDGHGALALDSYEQGGWWRRWTTLLPGNFDADAQSELLFFVSNYVEDQPRPGFTVGIYDVEPATQFTELIFDTEAWSVGRPRQQLVPVQLDARGLDELLFYSPEEGALQIYQLEADLQRSALSSVVYPEPFWKQVDSIVATPHR
jgi:hypothetical protein